MTTVVSIGCSHTHGSIIDGVNGTSEYNKNHAYGPQLAKLNGFNYYNLGQPGGSNQYIFRSAIEFLQKHIQPDEEYIFLIGWTSIYRMELRYDDQNRHRHVIMADYLDTKYIPFTVGTSKELMHTWHHRKLLDYAPLFFDDIQCYDEWAGFAYGLQEIFKSKNIKYLMFNTCQKIEETVNNKNIIEKFDTEKYLHPLDEKHYFINWAEAQGFEKSECWHHYEDAHVAWAKHIDKICKNLNYY